MFIGHFAPAFAAAAASSRAPKLGTLFIAGQLVDWGFFIFALFGIEKMQIEPGATRMVPFDLYYMPYTHSLLGCAVWAALFGLIVLYRYRDAVASMLASIVVLSHWGLDWLTHRPDLTLAGGERAYGLGMWNYPWLAMSLELIIVLLTFSWFIRRTKGPVGPPVILIVVLLLFQAINWFGPEPEVAGPMLYFTALISYAIVTALAYWVADTRWHKRETGLAAPRLRR